MRVIQKSTLATALAAWGAHEAAGRLRGKGPLPNLDTLTSLNIVLHYRSPFVARVLLREPMDVVEVELEPSDAEGIMLADTRTLSAWIDTTRTKGGEAFEYFQRAVESEKPPEGPFFAAATQRDAELGEIEAFIVYDGWHRLSAWFERIRQQRPSNIRGFLAVVRFDDPLMRRAA